MRVRQKFSFTLIEVLVVLALLISVGGVFGVQVQRLMHQQRFYNSVDRLVEKLQLGQELMLLNDRDHELRLTENKRGNLSATFVFDAPIPKVLAPLLERQTELAGIRYLAIHDGKDSNELNELRLFFLSHGSEMPRMVIELSDRKPRKGESDDSRLVRYIPLKGYIHPIQAERKYDLSFLEEEDCDALYPAEIL
ncbi:MAG: hypothetical protein CMO81_04580 [Waddliaceae bacterium]|nr:hypothetical protein [Waddliaceae bacterium]|tara:strand:+ start:97 stop:678 length:582 start_codon:yes stop_codon:yes gene_type:complete